jgi:hypothetical protein
MMNIKLFISSGAEISPFGRNDNKVGRNDNNGGCDTIYLRGGEELELFMVFLSIDYSERPVYLFQEDNPAHFMGKRHF